MLSNSTEILCPHCNIKIAIPQEARAKIRGSVKNAWVTLALLNLPLTVIGSILMWPPPTIKFYQFAIAIFAINILLSWFMKKLAVTKLKRMSKSNQ
jgi:hypothetical protein